MDNYIKKDQNMELTPKEVTAKYKIPQSTQQCLRAKKQITYIKRGGRIFYQKKWIEQYLRGELVPAKPAKK
jgi:hypothetical protein